MAYLLAILWGLVHGITEILPVSGSAHMAILERILGQQAARTEQCFFYGLLDLTLAVTFLIVYRQELCRMLGAKTRADSHAQERTLRVTARNNLRLTLLWIVGLLPLILEISLYPWAAAQMDSPFFWAVLLLCSGFILLFSTTVVTGEKNVQRMRLLDAFLSGIGQAISVLPGFSRTGLTVSVCVLRGVQPSFALTFSFLLAIPFWLGSGIIQIIRGCQIGILPAYLPAYLAGAVVCGLSAFAAFQWLNQILRKRRWCVFAFYCWAAAAFSFFMFLIT